MMSDSNSSAVQTQRKGWRERNSNGRNCLDEYGVLVECQSPPGFVLTDVDMPAGWQGLLHPEQDEYVARAVLHTHVFDPSLSDPDA
jgi:hypothetical protein